MRLIEKNGMLGIDKKEIDALIAKKKFIGLNHSPREEKVIVSLTSYKPRINDVKYTLYSLLNQTFPPDKLILWLDEDSFPQREKNLPRDLLKFESLGLTIDWCENLRPYKKLIPALEKYPDDIIVTADDDLFYRPDWLEILYDEHIKNPDCIVAHYNHRIRIDNLGGIYPFTRWYHLFTPAPSSSIAFADSAGTGGGLLLKKEFLNHDVLKRELFLKLAPIDDEIWIWAMAVLNNTKTKFPLAIMNGLIFNDIDLQINGEVLYRENNTKRDVWLARVIKHYPALLEKLIRETVDSKPYISVVMPIKNLDNLSACIENIFLQRFPDFEAIFINLGERVNLPPLPTNFHVIDYPSGSLANALNLGLRKAEGEYILFKGEDSILPINALEFVAQTADNYNADAIHFSIYIQLDGNNRTFIFEDAPELNQDISFLLSSEKQFRAVFWLQNKLNHRLDTKIFKREFLTKHGINFNDGTEEFLFAALTQAEKYLLVPQAFCSIRNEE